MSRSLLEIEAELEQARSHVAGLELSVVQARARIGTLQAGLAQAQFELARETGSLLVIGTNASRSRPVRVIQTECDLWEVTTGLRCVQPCRRHRSFGSEPVTVFKVDRIPEDGK